MRFFKLLNNIIIIISFTSIHTEYSWMTAI